jgi:hypothetical protein
MSGHGGPSHALAPSPRQHRAGEQESSNLFEDEMRAQFDPMERARRLQDYHRRVAERRERWAARGIDLDALSEEAQRSLEDAPSGRIEQYRRRAPIASRAAGLSVA